MVEALPNEEMNRAADTKTLAVILRVPPWVRTDVFIPFLVTRVALCLVAWIGFRIMPLPVTFPQAWEIRGDGMRHPIERNVSLTDHPMVNMLSRWDGGWYVDIAKSGYAYEPGRPTNVAFFPLYPILLRALHSLLFLPGSDYWWFASGILLSNAALFAALLYFRALLLLDFESTTAARAILYLLIFPTSFFLSSVYTESLFLLTTIAAFYYARKDRWMAAGAWAAAATLTRSQGALLLIPLLFEYLRQRKFSVRQVDTKIIAFTFIPLALFAFICFLQSKFGSWMLIFDAQRAWGRQLIWPWFPLLWCARHAPTLSAQHRDWLDLSFLCLLVLGTIAGARCLPGGCTLYALIAAAFFSSWGMLVSMPRFVLVVFPLFMALAALGQRSIAFHLSYVTAASMTAALFMVMHSQWNWVA